MSCDVGCRRSLDPALLRLWRRSVAMAPTQPLAWESPYASGAVLEKEKRQKKRKKKKKKFINTHVYISIPYSHSLKRRHEGGAQVSGYHTHFWENGLVLSGAFGPPGSSPDPMKSGQEKGQLVSGSVISVHFGIQHSTRRIGSLLVFAPSVPQPCDEVTHCLLPLSRIVEGPPCLPSVAWLSGQAGSPSSHGICAEQLRVPPRVR